MMLAHWRFLTFIVGCLVLGGTPLLLAQANKSVTTIQPLRLPNGFVVPLPIPNPPETILLTRDKYQELLDQIEKLQQQLDAQKAKPPQTCELEIRTEARGRQWLAKIKTVFKFTTTTPRTVVPLGGKNTQTLEAKLDDDQSPVLQTTDDGLAVLVETVGPHVLRLEWESAIGSRGEKGTELGFDLGLPACPITLLTVDPPAGVKRFTVTTKTPRAPTEIEQVSTERFQIGKGGVPLGPITFLGLMWDDPKAKVELPRSAEADIVTTVSDDEVTSVAKIRLRGTATEWRITAPATADVVVAKWTAPNAKLPTEFTPDRAPNVIRPEPGQGVWKIQFRDPPVGDVLATVTVRALRPRNNDPKARGPFTIGPFDVLDIPKQNGKIRIRTPANVRGSVVLKGETRRDPDEEGAYRYIRLAPMNAVSKDALLELTLLPVPSSVNGRLRHELRLTEFGWRVRSEISISPTRTEIEQLDLEVPASYLPLQGEPRDLVEGLSLTTDNNNGKTFLRVRLTAPKSTSFSLTIEGEYRLPPKIASAQWLLPSLVGVQTREQEVLVFVPSGFDVRGQLRAALTGKAMSWTTPLELQVQEREPRLRANIDAYAATLELTWKPITTGVAVRAVCDVDWGVDRAVVVQRLHYRFAGKPPARLRLFGDRVLMPRISTGTLEAVAEAWEILVPSDTQREFSTTLHYTLPLQTPQAGESVLPILRPEQADSFHTVRVWGPAEYSLGLARGDLVWQTKNTEMVDDRDSLPDLVLQTRGPHQAPVLDVSSHATAQRPPVECERAWFEIHARDRVAWCQMQWELVRWTADEAIVLLPVRARNVDMVLFNKSIRPQEWPANPSDSMRSWRLRLPSSGPRPTLLTVTYELTTDGLATFTPPTLEQASGPVFVQWRMMPQAGLVPLLYGGRPEGVWSYRSLLHDLNLPLSNAEPTTTEVSLQTGAMTSVRVVMVPRSVWVIGCSLGALLLGLLLLFVRRRYRRLLLLLLLVGTVVMAVYAPQMTARVLSGSLLGLLAFAALVLVFLFMQRRYQRRLARLPSFARATSTFVRPSKVRPVGSAGSQPLAADPS